MKEKTGRILTAVLVAAILCCLLSGCGSGMQTRQQVRYDLFDTVCTVTSYCRESEKTFEENCEAVFAILEKYHRLFDIYHEYEGLTNLCTVNRLAGGEPVSVDTAVIELLETGREMYRETDGTVNIMMGSVLSLWHDAREIAETDPEKAAPPEDEMLKQASRHMAMTLLEIDVEKQTVRITDPEASLDVGAIAKGYATEQVAQWLEERGISGYVLNVGGNIRVIGTKPDGKGWITGIREPDLSSSKAFALTVELKDISCVTSGDYERYFTVKDTSYHHLIDPLTLYPARFFTSVTVLTKDSARADALSTAFFCMPLEEGRKLAEEMPGVDVIWITHEGEIICTEGAEAVTVKEDPAE